ncbi:MAG: molybdopterin biosynthesis protein MoeY [Candidatus Dormibacteria bacterium]
MAADTQRDRARERLCRILDLGRWAPSGDNTQPWRFEIVSEHHLVVYGSDTRHQVVFDLEGHASQLSIGTLLESLAIAASGEGQRSIVSYRTPESLPDEHPTFDVRFEEDPAITPDVLLPFLMTRCTNRRPLGTRPLSPDERREIETASAPPECRFPAHRIVWLESGSEKRAMASIAQRAGRLRLTIPEAWEVHREVIEWSARFSADRIPDQALGLPYLVLPLMRRVMASWPRISFFNHFPGATLLPRIGLDILPALRSSAHFILMAPSPPESVEDYLASGRALCRFWLATTRQGLQFQPEMAPLIFGSYVRRRIAFSKRPGAMEEAGRIASALDGLIHPDPTDRAVFLGRVGRGSPPRSRSLRLPLSTLLRS